MSSTSHIKQINSLVLGGFAIVLVVGLFFFSLLFSVTVLSIGSFAIRWQWHDAIDVGIILVVVLVLLLLLRVVHASQVVRRKRRLLGTTTCSRRSFKETDTLRLGHFFWLSLIHI